MTLEEEIEGWKRLCNSWKRDCKYYEAGLKRMREYAINNNQPRAVVMINDILAHEGQDGIPS